MYASNVAVRVCTAGAFSNVCVCFNYLFRHMVFTARLIEIELDIWKYIYIKYETRTEEQSLLPWILLTNRYMLWQRISKIAKHRDRIVVTLSRFYFLLALGRNRVRKYLAREQYFDPFDPLPVKQFRDLSTYPSLVRAFSILAFATSPKIATLLSLPPTEMLAISLTFDRRVIPPIF